MIKVTENQVTILYNSVNKMMRALGAQGEVNTRDYVVLDVMEALKQIDGGVYNESETITFKGE